VRWGCTASGAAGAAAACHGGRLPRTAAAKPGTRSAALTHPWPQQHPRGAAQAEKRFGASEAAALQAALRARQAELDAALTDAAAARAADGGHAERLQRQLVEATGAPGPRCATGGPGLLTGTL